MARIPLRAYNREIENLIERGQIEEAIAHCKNILKQFPKHIETYRLLGKSFLESQRYAEAADILQRVLSVFPDDFVSQLGMSIIREDEGNLDAAIWHMERAYEVQPFNRPVQDELRRLYGRRDGAEPPRIRLTRGALVRMYARGDLYPQAIAEIRAALAEDQTRIDLIVLLSRMYYLSGQKIEATEICSSLISKLPYCYEANRVLKDVLPETSRAEDARIFQQRLFSLDPYAAFISPNAPTSAQVPEQTVMVEKVEWQPSMTDAQSPDWARTIGVSWEETSEEILPDWLNTIQPGQAAPADSFAAPELVDEQPKTSNQPPDELIPGFLKEAGWTPSDGTVEEQPLAFEESSDTEEEGEIVEAEIPEWLQSLAPETQNLNETEEIADEASQMGWLEGLIPAGLGAAATAEEVSQPESIHSDTDEITSLPEGLAETVQEDTDRMDWLQEPPSEAGISTQEEVTSIGETTPVPDWLSELSAAAPDETTTAEELPSAESAGLLLEETPDDTPEWIRQAETEQPDVSPIEEPQMAAAEPLTTDEALPDWLVDLKQEAPAEPSAAVELETESSLEAAIGTPEQVTAAWIPEEQVSLSEELISADLTSQEAEATTAPSLDSMDMDAAMAWMEALAARQGADAESLMITPEDERSETPPEWLQQQSAEVEEVQPEAITEEPVSIKTEPEEIDEVIQPVDLSPEELTETAEQIVAPQMEETPVPPEGDLDSALAWMEALAARQGADEESLKISEPELRSETPPDWLAELAAAPDEPEPPVEETVDVQDQTSTPIATIEETYTELPAAVEEGFVSEISGEGAETAGVIEEATQEVSAEAPTVISEMDADSAFAWMEALAAKQGAEEGSLVTTPEERPEAAPEWVTETIQEEPEMKEGDLAAAVSDELPATQDYQVGVPEGIEPSIEPTMETPPPQTATPEAEIPDWLRSYEEEQRTQEPAWKPDETFTPETVAEEELPDWLKDEPVQEPAAEVTPPVPELTQQVTAEIPSVDAPSEMPEWLRALQESQPVPETPQQSTPPETTWVPEFKSTPPASEKAVPQPAPISSDALALAQATLRSGDVEAAAEQYTQIINAGQNLDTVIQDLHTALDQHPVDVSLWQALGDAYIRSNRVQEALDAYTKAEELLR